MDCNCKQCRGVDMPDWEMNEPEEEEVETVIGTLAKTLEAIEEKYSHDKQLMKLIGELDWVHDEIVSIDNEIFKLQKEAKEVKAGKLSFKLGELSKRITL